MKINGVLNLQAYQKYSMNVNKTEKKAAYIPKQDHIDISSEGREAALRNMISEIESDNENKAFSSNEVFEQNESDNTDNDKISENEQIHEKEDSAQVNKTEEQSGAVAFNAAKRARQLAAANTKELVRTVLDLLKQDLSECKEGLSKGMCDEDEVAKVEAMIQRANERMSQVSREGQKENDYNSELAFAIASLM